MSKKGKSSFSTPISSIKHDSESRVNIPTEELRDFVTEEEKAPKVMLYPRDTSLDPQLVWKGKDEQDAKPLEVLTVPIYIQEKVHPQAIIENLRETAKAGELEPELALFNDFNGIKFEDQIDFYKHEQHWQNRMILGDSLLVMNSLAEKEGVRGGVQMIYFDPPYGIKFSKNWQVEAGDRKPSDSSAVSLQPEQIRAFRDTWNLGIHSYLSYLRDRLVVAHSLLSPTGSIFVQISEDNLNLVLSLLDEVFGKENRINIISFQKTGSQDSKFLGVITDFICWYAKDKQQVKYRPLFDVRPERADDVPSPDPISSEGTTERGSLAFRFQGKEYFPGKDAHWKTHPEGMVRLAIAGRILPQRTRIRFAKFFSDFPVKDLSCLWLGLGGDRGMIYIVQTNPEVIQRCMLMATDPGDIVLDPTCGSGTTAYVAEQWGRRWITIDTSRVALALARTRLMSAKFPYYTLKDNNGELRHGFNYKTVPHIKLHSIANNAEIDLIYDKYQQQMEPLREELNNLLKTKYEEWEMPREPDEKWAKRAKEMHTEWWSLRRRRQQEIDGSIARRADTEYLYDQPEEDKKRIRVTGPFTVESLSPHRVLETKETPIGGAPLAYGPASDDIASFSGDNDFVSVIIENLRKAGVQNTKQTERLKFTRIEAASGPYIHAKGFYEDAVGKERIVAISIGPEHGTVSTELIEQAATETARARPKYDALYVLGFSFDAQVDTERKKYGALQINMTHMNPDLAMGDELLKKTGAGNLFMVFGEPDIKLEKTASGMFTITINGVDIYDPTTGEVRSDSTDDIACWFLDTNYDEKSFFVRHAYFLGDNDPYGKLKRALRAEIDEGTWSTLYSNISRSFEPPTSGKIAVKVINMYGDEVMKVYEVK